MRKANILHVKNFVVDDVNNDLVEESINQELLKSQCNNTNINKSDTDINNTSSKDAGEKVKKKDHISLYGIGFCVSNAEVFFYRTNFKIKSGL